MKQMKRNLWQILFVFVLAIGCALSFLVIYQMPVNDVPTPFNNTTRVVYVLYSIASLFAR